MKKVCSNHERRRSIVISLILTACIAAALTVGLATRTDEFRLDTTPPYVLDSGWINAQTGGTLESASLSIGIGEKYILKRSLPANLGDHAVLGVYDSGCRILAYVDNALVYSSGGNTKAIGEEMGALWRTIPLSATMSGREIYLVLENISDTALRIDLSRCIIGTEGNVALSMGRSNMLGICISALCLVAALLVAVLSYFLKKAEYPEYAERMKALALLTLVISIWGISDGSSTQFIFHNASARYVTSYMVFILVPVFVNRFFQSISHSDNMIYNMIGNIYKVGMSICILLYIFGFVHISDTIFVVHVYLLIEILLMGYDAYRNFKANHSVANKGSIAAFGVVLCFWIVGMARFYSLAYSSIAVTIELGYMLFLVVMAQTQIRHILDDYRARNKERVYKSRASVDAVTGGNTKVVAYDFLGNDALYEKGRPILVHMDLIEFAAINAVLGREKGNELMRGIYTCAGAALQEGELEFNAGGSNFAFILLAGRDIDAFCLRVSGLIEEYLRIGWGDLVLDVKYSAIPAGRGDDLDGLLDCALMAYKNSHAEYHKEAGCYYYTEACRKEVRRQFDLKKRISAAMEKHEFEMYLQPKMNPATRELVGAEALIRWNSPYEGMISPQAFMPAAEKSGQVEALDLYMFRRMCEYLATADEKGYPKVPISINISKVGIHREDFFDGYLAIIRELSVPARYLQFEFSEAFASAEIDSLSQLGERIHQAGAAMIMDNYGSDSSNLAAISRLRFDMVKIDRQLMNNGFPDNMRDYTIIKGAVNTFHELGLQVAGEGVETKEQSDALRELGIDMLQGFYYAKPMPVAQFVEKYRIKK